MDFIFVQEDFFPSYRTHAIHHGCFFFFICERNYTTAVIYFFLSSERFAGFFVFICFPSYLLYLFLSIRFPILFSFLAISFCTFLPFFHLKLFFLLILVGFSNVSSAYPHPFRRARSHLSVFHCHFIRPYYHLYTVNLWAEYLRIHLYDVAYVLKLRFRYL